VREQEDRQHAAEVARRFSVALTTYDYAHLDVRLATIASITSAAVRTQVVAASRDVGTAKASSLGDAFKVVVVNATDSLAEVLVETSQLVRNVYVQSATRLAGLLDVTVAREDGVWLVSGFRWLLVPSIGP
jgi:hypothetical protein